MADHLETVDTGEAPTISPRTRTIVYVFCLAVNIFTVVALGLAVVFALLPTGQALAAGAVVLGGVNLLSSGLSVGYRPTRFGAPQ